MTRSADAAACFDDFVSALGESGEINTATVSVLIKRDIDIVDDEGNVRHVAALVYADKSDFPAWAAGDLLEAPSGNVRLQKLLGDNGFIQKIQATPASSA